MKITTVIPAYNAVGCIERAINSVLRQSRPSDEIIVVDDGSTDETASVVAEFGEKVTLIQQGNAGVSAARNTGIRAAAGDWIAFLDADDEWLPEKLKLQCDHLQRNPQLEWTAGMYFNCDCNRNHTKTFRLSPAQRQKVITLLDNHEYFNSYFTAFSQQANSHINAMLFRKEILEKAGLFLVGQKIGEDDDLCLRLAYMRLPMGIILDPVMIYHLGEQESATKKHRERSHIQMLLDRHFNLARQAAMLEEFQSCAAAKLAFWIRKLLYASAGRDVRMLIKKYGYLLNTGFRLSAWCGSYFPAAWTYKEKLKRKYRKA